MSVLTILGGRSNLLEHHLNHEGLSQSPRLSSVQWELACLSSSFVSGASDWKSLISMTLGGLAYKAGKLVLLGRVYKGLALGTSLALEVGTFRLSEVLLRGQKTSLAFEARGFLSSSLDFALLKSVGYFFQGQNIVLSHVFQSTAMVLGHEGGAQLGLIQSEQGSWVQRFARAEITNIQMIAGMGLSNLFLPRLKMWEQSAHLFVQSIHSPHTKISWNPSLLPHMATDSVQALCLPYLEIIEKEGIDSADGKKALQKMTPLLMPWLRRVVVKHWNLAKGLAPQLEFDDLVQEAWLGLRHSLRKYDRTRSAITTYANREAERFVLAHILENKNQTDVPEAMLRKFHRLQKDIEGQDLEDGPTREALAKKWGVKEKNLDRSIARARIVGNGFERSKDERPENGRSLEDQLAAEGSLSDSNLDLPADGELAKHYEAFGNSIQDPRLKLVYEARIWTRGSKAITLARLGKQWGISRERVRQLDERVRDQLKTYLLNAGLQIPEEFKIEKSSKRTPWEAPPSSPPFGVLLKSLRARKGLSQVTVVKELACRRVSVNVSTIIRIEAAQTIPAFEILEALAKLYEVDVRDLIVASNRSHFPQFDTKDWSTQYYPIYLEGNHDRKRMESFRAHEAPKKTLGWLIYSKRKDPAAYRYVNQFQGILGYHAKSFDRFELNQLYPAFKLVQALSRWLGIPANRLIEAANRTHHPQLALKQLFPYRHIYLEPGTDDVAKVQAYQQKPGSLGQILFAHRKSLPGGLSASEMDHQLGYRRGYWNYREWIVDPVPIEEVRVWIQLFHKAGIPVLHLQQLYPEYNLDPHGYACLLMHALPEESVEAFAAQHRLDRATVDALLVVPRDKAIPVVKADTILRLQEALPELRGDLFYRALHPEVAEIFPETTLKNPFLLLTPLDLHQAATLDLRYLLYAYRMDQGMDLIQMAGKLGVIKNRARSCEILVETISNIETIQKMAELLGISPRVLYLHFYPQILRLFYMKEYKVGKNRKIDVSQYKTYLELQARHRDASNMRWQVWKAMETRGLHNLKDLAAFMGVSEEEAAKYWKVNYLLTEDHIRVLTRYFPELSFQEWFEYFHHAALTYFLGNATGKLQYPSKTEWEAIQAFDLYAELNRALDQYPKRAEVAEETGVKFLTSQDSLNSCFLSSSSGMPRKPKYGWRDETIARISRGLNLDRRLLYLYFHQQELQSFSPSL